MFFMRRESFLFFQRGLEVGRNRSNCQTLFGIERIPADTYIRQKLDEVDPALLKPCFEQACSAGNRPIEWRVAEPSVEEDLSAYV
jgi:hypothetical protein